MGSAGELTPALAALVGSFPGILQFSSGSKLFFALDHFFGIISDCLCCFFRPDTGIRLSIRYRRFVLSSSANTSPRTCSMRKTTPVVPVRGYRTRMPRVSSSANIMENDSYTSIKVFFLIFKNYIRIFLSTATISRVVRRGSFLHNGTGESFSEEKIRFMASPCEGPYPPSSTSARA